MAKLNKTRMIAATLLGSLFLGAPITSYAQDFRSSNSINARVISSGFNNRVVTQSRFNTGNNFNRRSNFIGRNNFNTRSNFGFNNRRIISPVFAVKSKILTPKVTLGKIISSKVIVTSPSRFSSNRRGFR